MTKRRTELFSAIVISGGHLMACSSSEPPVTIRVVFVEVRATCAMVAPRVGISDLRIDQRKEAWVNRLLLVSLSWDLGLLFLAPHSAARPNEVQPAVSGRNPFPGPKAGTLTSFRRLGIRGGFTKITPPEGLRIRVTRDSPART